MLFYWPKMLGHFLSFTGFRSLDLLYIGWYCGAGVFRLIFSVNHSLPTLHCRPLLIIIIIIIEVNFTKLTHSNNNFYE